MDSWLHLKMYQLYLGDGPSSWPWRLALIPDPRADKALVRRVGTQFLKARLCNVDEFFGRRYRQLFPDLEVDELIGEDGGDRLHPEGLLSWCWVNVVTTMEVENRNARDVKKIQAGAVEAFENFCARCINSDALAAQRARQTDHIKQLGYDSDGSDDYEGPYIGLDGTSLGEDKGIMTLR